MDQRSLYLVRQALNAVFKRRRMVLLLFLLIVVPSNVGNVLRPPQYRANAKVLIDNSRTYPEVSPLTRQASVDRPPNETVINSEIQLMRSRDLLLRVHLALAAQAADAGQADARVPSVTTLDQKVSVLRKPNSNVVQVAYRSSDPDLAINVVNTLAHEYIKYSIEMRRSPGALEFFYQQAQDAKEAYEVADRELERYDAAHGLTSIAVEKDQMLRQRAQLEADMRRSEAEITELTTKTAALEAEIDYIPDHEATEVDMIPNPMVGYLRQNLAKLEMERSRLLQLYTPQHRLVMDVESEIAGLKQQIVTQETTIVGRKRMSTTGIRRDLEQNLLQSQADLGALEARRALLGDRISDYDARIRVMHAKHYQVMRLRRERTERKQLYDALVDKLNQLQVSEAMDKAGISNVTIVEAASGPLKKEPDFFVVTLLLSFFAALLISIGSAIVTEMLNPVMNSDIDVRHHLGLPVLAEIPLNGMNGGNENGNDDDKQEVKVG
jgi:succinoglycan biosynthesis transport protein ExoP